MPRPRRHEGPGAVHHVWARGVDRRDIFLDDDDRHDYIACLGAVVEECRWDCLAHCLMSNHIHLLIRTRRPNLGRGMQQLHSLYALGFNAKYGRSGHLFERRYGSSRIWTPERLVRTLDYIAQNPVEAGLCRAPGEWPWAGSADAGLVQSVAAVLDS
jgi:putative transposase